METLPIINLVYEIYKLTADVNGHAEKRWRYSLGSSLESTILACLENLILAKNAPTPLKSGFLIKANAQLEIATLKFRLFLELGVANETRIFQAQAMIRETGRMLGGWLKSLQNG